jgi:hypothetical protein
VTIRPIGISVREVAKGESHNEAKIRPHYSKYVLDRAYRHRKLTADVKAAINCISSRKKPKPSRCQISNLLCSWQSGFEEIAKNNLHTNEEHHN